MLWSCQVTFLLHNALVSLTEWIFLYPLFWHPISKWNLYVHINKVQDGLAYIWLFDDTYAPCFHNGLNQFISWCNSLTIFAVCLCQRICIEEIRNDEWFKKNYVPARLLEYEDVNLDDVNAVFDDSEVGKYSKGASLIYYFPAIFILWY